MLGGTGFFVRLISPYSRDATCSQLGLEEVEYKLLFSTTISKRNGYMDQREGKRPRILCSAALRPCHRGEKTTIIGDMP